MLVYRSATELARLIRARALSPVELMRAVLERAQSLQPTLNAFITLCSGHAMDAAREAERKIVRGDPVGDLHGIPFSVKDLINTRDVRTTHGSLIFKDHVPTSDSIPVARLKAAGAILIGKTTTPEFGQKGLTEAPLFGRTCNAWSAERTCGGSSGGSAVAVACGMAPLSLGTDGGGSTRIPAACNGVVGIKQSLGVVPSDSAQDAFGNISYTTPMTRTVEDTALMLDIIAGPHRDDPHSLGRAKQDYRGALNASDDLRGVRVAWRALLGNSVLSADVRRAFESAQKVFADLGAEVSEVREPFDNAEELWLKVNGSYRLAQFGGHLRAHRDLMDPTLVAQLESAGRLSAEELYQAIFLRTKLFRDVQRWFDTADIVLTPTLARTALPLTHQFFDKVEIDGHITDTMRRAWYPYTLPFNMTGHPALSIPCGWGQDGLPIGLQMIGRVHEDTRLLHAAALFEKALPWQHRTPPLGISS